MTIAVALNRRKLRGGDRRELGGERGAPLGEADAELLLGQAAVEARVLRPTGRCGVVGHRDRQHAFDAQRQSCDAAQSKDFLGKTMPARLTRTGKMECATTLAKAGDRGRRGRLEDLGRSRGHERRRRRGAHLLGDDAQLGSLQTQLEHCADEVVTVRGIDPGDAQDQMRGARRANGLFAGEFRAAIGVEGVCCVRFAPGARAGAVENIVGRIMHQRRTASKCFFGPTRPARRR